MSKENATLRRTKRSGAVSRSLSSFLRDMGKIQYVDFRREGFPGSETGFVTHTPTRHRCLALVLAVITALPWPVVLLKQDTAPVVANASSRDASAMVSPSRKASPLAEESPIAEAELRADDEEGDSDDLGRWLTFCAFDGGSGILRREGTSSASMPSARIPNRSRTIVMRPLRC